MRHIPDEELNAYLDQALSRSQCIEIETHLALCSACRRNRDGIAALRDRTTALLALTAPRRVSPPAWVDMQSRAVVAGRSRPWKRSALWAASVAGALLAGWGLRTASDPHGVLAENSAPALELPPIVATIPTVTLSAAPVDPIAQPADPTPAYGSDTEVQLAATHRPAPAEEPPPVVSSGALSLESGWSVVSLTDAEEQTGRLVPILPDYPIVQVLLRQAAGAGRPLLLVTQHQPDGGPIHTIEGPVEEVADLVAAQLSPAVGLKSSEPSRSPPDYIESAGSVRRTSRVLAVMGQVSVDSLNVLAAGVVLK